MNTRLKTAIHALDTKGEALTEDVQEALAGIIEASLSETASEPLLTPAQLSELDRRIEEDTQNATPEDVRAVFRRHGIDPRI